MAIIATLPLRIAELPVGRNGGILGLSMAPGKKGPSIFGGSHHRNLDEDLDLIRSWGAAAVVTLMLEDELERFAIPGIGEAVRSRFMEWHHLPIVDGGIPDARFEGRWLETSRRLRSLLEAGNRIFVHCRGGLGRAGLVSGRLLVEMGTDPEEAIVAVRSARSRHAIETVEQEDWVRIGKPSLSGVTSGGTRDRALGALVGLAVGDAVGTTIEFSAKPDVPVLFDMVGGGPFALEVGQWTDDTSMALALADCLIDDPRLDADKLMRLFTDWRLNGAYSSTGTCFDIGQTTALALARFDRDGYPFAGDANPGGAGNGSIMRLAPVAVRHWSDRDELLRVARLQSRTTHGAPQAVECSELLAEILAEAIEGRSFHEIMTGRAVTLVPGFRVGLPRDEVQGTGYVVDCLHAALWAVSRTTSFESAVLMAVNLGDDADTTGAVAGQIAGAIYGLSGIPDRWLEKLAWRDRIVGMADELFRSGCVVTD